MDRNLSVLSDRTGQRISKNGLSFVTPWNPWKMVRKRLRRAVDLMDEADPLGRLATLDLSKLNTSDDVASCFFPLDFGFYTFCFQVLSQRASEFFLNLTWPFEGRQEFAFALLRSVVCLPQDDDEVPFLVLGQNLRWVLRSFLGMMNTFHNPLSWFCMVLWVHLGVTGFSKLFFLTFSKPGGVWGFQKLTRDFAVS